MDHEDQELWSEPFELPGELHSNGNQIIIKSEKAIVQGQRQLDFGHEYDPCTLIESNYNLQEFEVVPMSPLPLVLPEEITENPINPEPCFDHISDFSILDLKSFLNNPRAFLATQISVLPSQKTKNPPYLVKEKDIFTKNVTPVSFKVIGIEAGDSIHVSLRFSDEFHKKNPVSPCKLHEDFRGRPTSLPKGYGFYILQDMCQYQEETNHPTGIINIVDPTVGSMEFCSVFLCLNSCHRDNGKHTELLITVYNSEKVVKKEEKFTIRVCKNVKRDYREKIGEFSLKRPASVNEQEQVPRKCQKIQKLKPEQVCKETSTSTDGVLAKEEDKTRIYTFQMQNKKQEEIMLTLIELIGGRVDVVPQ